MNQGVLSFDIIKVKYLIFMGSILEKDLWTPPLFDPPLFKNVYYFFLSISSNLTTF